MTSSDSTCSSSSSKRPHLDLGAELAREHRGGLGVERAVDVHHHALHQQLGEHVLDAHSSLSARSLTVMPSASVMVRVIGGGADRGDRHLRTRVARSHRGVDRTDGPPPGRPPPGRVARTCRRPRRHAGARETGRAGRCRRTGCDGSGRGPPSGAAGWYVGRTSDGRAMPDAPPRALRDVRQARPGDAAGRGGAGRGCRRTRRQSRAARSSAAPAAPMTAGSPRCAAAASAARNGRPAAPAAAALQARRCGGAWLGRSATRRLRDVLRAGWPPWPRRTARAMRSPPALRAGPARRVPASARPRTHRRRFVDRRLQLRPTAVGSASSAPRTTLRAARPVRVRIGGVRHRPAAAAPAS